MKRLLIIFTFLCVAGCASFREIEGFTYIPQKTKTFEIAAWGRINAPGKPLRIYIEGDGFAWKNVNTPSDDPTPTKDLVLDLARQDKYPNVIYMARPCQYTNSSACEEYYWTNGRFSIEVIEAMETVIQKLMKKYKSPSVELVGYSGGGTIAALIAARQPSYVTRLVTVAGILDHKAWTSFHRDTPLRESLNPASYKKQLSKVKQVHFIGVLDENVPAGLTEKFVQSYEKPASAEVIIVPNATHDTGWVEVWPRLMY